MKTQITQAVRVALVGSHKVKVTFRREAIFEVSYLLGMAKSGIVQLNNGTETTLRVVAQSRDWGDDQNRTATVTLMNQFDEDWFVERMYRALEKIEAIS